MAALFRMERNVSTAKVEQVGRIAVESILTVTVGVLIGRLAWAVLAPAEAVPATGITAVESPSSVGAGQNLFILTEMNPFQMASGTIAAELVASGETALELKLAGVRAVSGNTAASSAIIAFPDGSQKRMAPGDEVLPGVLLVNVTAESVHLSRDGALETLSLNPERNAVFAAGSGLTPAPAPALTDAGTITPADVVADTILTPEFRSGQVSGYRLAPRGHGAFEAAGLESGDLILRINGEAIEGLRPEQISQSVARGPDVSLDVVRQGAIVRLRVPPGASLSQ